MTSASSICIHAAALFGSAAHCPVAASPFYHPFDIIEYAMTDRLARVRLVFAHLLAEMRRYVDQTDTNPSAEASSRGWQKERPSFGGGVSLCIVPIPLDVLLAAEDESLLSTATTTSGAPSANATQFVSDIFSSSAVQSSTAATTQASTQSLSPASTALIALARAFDADAAALLLSYLNGMHASDQSIGALPQLTASEMAVLKAVLVAFKEVHLDKVHKHSVPSVHIDSNSRF